MDSATRAAIVAELSAAFGGARDVSSAPDQPLCVELNAIRVPPPWRPSPAKALMCFEGWPDRRPGFWIAPEVVNDAGQPPQSSGDAYVLGGRWRAFSFQFPWNGGSGTPTRVVQLWLTRFRLAQ